MEIRSCKWVDIKEIVDIFNRGFSDYMIQHTWSIEAFEERFLGPEGNRLEHSFIAFLDGKAVGLMLGGIRQYDGMKTMRCGGMCMDPKHRGSGIAQALFERHKRYAIEMACGQLFLEVIKGNDRAVKFYQNCGYDAVYNILYYSQETKVLISKIAEAPIPQGVEFAKGNIENLKNFRKNLEDCHMNWQCEPESFNHQNGGSVMMANLQGKPVAIAGMNPSGKVYFLWVSPEHRRKGIGSNLVLKMAELLGVDRLNFSTPNSSSCVGFFRKLDCRRDSLEQFEMYLPL